MSIEQKIYDGIEADLAPVISLRVKRSLKALIKERKDKKQKIAIADDLTTLRSHYIANINKLFDAIENEAFTNGVIAYAGYVERVEDDE